ncbi:MAG: ABC transporter permease [Chloroflexi bacterium]|nr:ABC transporter permease [Chloroflexota bacterium]
MGAYAIRRVLWLIPTLLGVSVIIFTLLHVAPGDAARAMLDANASEEEVNELREALGLNRPLPIQYAAWVGNVLQGDLGKSYSRRTDVRDDLFRSVKNTLVLAMTSAVLVIVIGSSLGTIAAFNRGRFVDKLVTALAITGLAVPSFWLAIVLVIVFSVQLGWLPSAGMQSLIGGGSIGDIAKHLVLPSIALASGGIGVLARFVRTTVLDLVGQEFVVALRARGIKTGRIVVHVMKNAAPPLMTLMGLQFAGLLGGSVLVETVFTYPGTGWLMNIAIFQRDVPIIMAAVLLLSSIYVVANLLVDLTQGLIDPRIRRG